VKVRAAIGAATSFSDALSDAYMVNVYYTTGRSSTANGLLGMVGANISYQLFVSYLQMRNRKNDDKWRAGLFEILAIVSFTKPGVDAYRVASGSEQDPGAFFDPISEMAYTKFGELVLEAVPGLVLQLVAVLTAEENTNSAYARDRCEASAEEEP
jgi:hypothetical protein